MNSLTKIVSIGCMVAFGIYLGVRLKLIYFYGISIGGLENNVIYGVEKILVGKALYSNPEVPPFDLIQKSPAYYFLIAKLAQLFKLSIAEPIELFRLSRWVSLLLNLATVVFTFLSLRKVFKVGTLLALALSCLFMMNFTDHYYSRMDALYGAEFTLIIFLLLRQFESFQKQAFFWMGVLVSFLFFTKQNGAMLGIIIGVLLVIQKWPKAILPYLLGGLAGLLSAWFLFGLQLIPFYQNVFLGIHNGFDISALLRVLKSEIHVIWLVASMVVFIVGIRHSKTAVRIVAGLGIFYYLIGLASMIKVASGLNYLIELKYFALLLMGILVSQKEHFKLYLLGLFATLLLLTVVMNTKDFRDNTEELYLNEPEKYQRTRELAKWMVKNLEWTEGAYIYVGEENFLTYFFPDRAILPIRSTTHEIIKTEQPVIDYSPLLLNKDKGLIKYIITEKKEIKEVLCLNQPFENFQFLIAVNGFNIFQYNGE